MARVCVIGSSNLDFTVSVSRLPGVGETVSGGTLVTSPGGKGANQAVAARRLGAEVSFVTLLGADPMGDRLASALGAAGLPPEPIARTQETATGVALISVDPEGRNQIAVAPGANHQLTVERVRAHAGLLAWADVVLLQLETPIDTVRWALEEARRLGKRTVLNPAPARVLPLPADLLPLVDYLTPNEIEAGLLTDREVRTLDDAETAGRALVGRGVSVAVVTLGAAGAVAVRAAGAIRVPAFPVEAIDTVGAGDAFSGGLAACVAAGAPIEDALLVASAAAALTCTRRGAVDAMPSREEVVDHGRPPRSAAKSRVVDGSGRGDGAARGARSLRVGGPGGDGRRPAGRFRGAERLRRLHQADGGGVRLGPHHAVPRRVAVVPVQRGQRAASSAGSPTGGAAGSVLAASGVLLGVGALGAALIVSLWQLHATVGVIIAVGAGGASSGIAAAMASRWFDSRRGLAIGIAGGAMAAGQLLVVPLAMWLMLSWGWRTAFVVLGVGFLAIVLPLILALIRNDPRDMGLEPYGAVPGARTGRRADPSVERTTLRDAIAHHAVLAPGRELLGLRLHERRARPHPPDPARHRARLPRRPGGSGARRDGRLQHRGDDRVRLDLRPLRAEGSPGRLLRPARPVARVPALRRDRPGLFAWAVVFGLNFISTVPATTALTAKIYGRYSVGELSGWIFFSHQIGSAVGSLAGGLPLRPPRRLHGRVPLGGAGGVRGDHHGAGDPRSARSPGGRPRSSWRRRPASDGAQEGRDDGDPDDPDGLLGRRGHRSR